MKNIQIVQGDVFLEAVDALPKGLKKAENNILAYGEVTGHVHMIDGVDVMEDEKTKDKYIHIPGDVQVELKHILEKSGIWTGEHRNICIDTKEGVITEVEPGVGVKKTTKIEPGKELNLKFTHQVAYDPYEKIINQMSD